MSYLLLLVALAADPKDPVAEYARLARVEARAEQAKLAGKMRQAKPADKPALKAAIAALNETPPPVFLPELKSWRVGLVGCIRGNVRVMATDPRGCLVVPQFAVYSTEAVRGTNTVTGLPSASSVLVKRKVGEKDGSGQVTLIGWTTSADNEGEVIAMPTVPCVIEKIEGNQAILKVLDTEAIKAKY